jgi:hypothetical protein
MSNENASRDVTVGGRTYTVARLRGLKAQLILRESAKLAREYPKIGTMVAEFEQTYADENAVVLNRAEAEYRLGAAAGRISDDAWQSSGNQISLKSAPSTFERLFAAWPEILEVGERPVANLLAIVSLSNEELADADKADDLAAKIEDRRQEIWHNGEIEEIVELAIAGYEVSRGQFAPLVGKVLPLLGLLGIPMMGEPEQTESGTSPTPTTTSQPSSSSSETSPSSSTDSPEPTGGPESKPSAPPGSPSDAAPTT